MHIIIPWHHIRFLFTELQKPLGLDEPHDELADFDARFKLILHKHIAILGWWSVFNIAGGLIALFFFKGPMYYFWMMGVVWGLINLAVAIKVFDHIFFSRFRKGDVLERMEAQWHVEKLMFLNIGIDTAYIFVGLFLREHSFVPEVFRPGMWLGFGWSVMAQGVFLLIQDISVYRLHWKNYRKADPYFETLMDPEP